MPSEVTALREEIAHRALRYAESSGIPFYRSLGASPTIMFEPYAQGIYHGNFITAAYRAILSEPDWRKRLDKPHQRANALPLEKRGWARELDSSNSSDALLMNVFCYPGSKECGSLARLFGFQRLPRPAFGAPGEVPLVGGRTDSTELDMKLDSVHVEAKLCESGFTNSTPERLATYRDFHSVFWESVLPKKRGEYLHYQLIRNVLAIAHSEGHFYLLCDARRSDLIVAFEGIIAAIQVPAVRSRCHRLSWQSLATTMLKEVTDFLGRKYGILPGA